MRPVVDGAAWLTLLACASFSRMASADPIRLRGDAVASTQSPDSQSPSGLLILQGSDKVRPNIEAEGLVWAGARPDATGDVLVLAVHLHTSKNYGEMRVGRFVMATGSMFPVQMDGVDGIARTPWGSGVEAFGGVPVVPRFTARPYEWLAGTRLSQMIAAKATLGMTYVERHDDGELARREIGGDLAAVAGKWVDVGARGAYDLTSPGIADARISAATRYNAYRLEVFASDQSPGRLLPATSLFSVLGDFPSQMLGGTLRWAAAPRLDLLAGGAAQDVAGAFGGNGWIRSTLRLDDKGEGRIGLELRRVDVSTSKWSGVRVIGSQPIAKSFRFSTELEVVVPDEPNGRGFIWPWGLMALSWRSHTGWEVAGAVEGDSSP
ncbi:MAG: hypothetical protein ABI183_08610, partial [Polyangiaceae bacterium]